ncbi:hypothetical protein MTO96_007604 [Rhipicephalus appendiculatus]
MTKHGLSSSWDKSMPPPKRSPMERQLAGWPILVLCCTHTPRGGDTTVASVYIRPQQPWDPRCLQQLAHRLGREFLLCGDVNAHHPAWGGRRTDPRFREVRDVLQHLGLVNLNTGADTRPPARPSTSAWPRRAAGTPGRRYRTPGGLDHLPILLSPLPRQGPPGPRVPLGGMANLPAAVAAGHWRQGPPVTGG